MTSPLSPSASSNIPANLYDLAAVNIRDILEHSIKFSPTNGDKILVVYDTKYELTEILTNGYRSALLAMGGDCLEEAKFLDFYEISLGGKETILCEFDKLKKGDVVALIQSSNFRLDDFRIRLHLFSKGLKVIEHMHLYRNASDVFDVYLNSLKYDVQERAWYNSMAKKLCMDLCLEEKLEGEELLSFKSRDAELVLKEGVEYPKLNIGSYDSMDNTGGTFPIGEVFTEAKNLFALNGSAYLYAFANREFNISFHPPFRVDIKDGLITGCSEDAPQEFRDILELVSSYERPIIREIGFGLNRAMTKERFLGDITAFERIMGVHMSLGEKHSVYKKPGITTHKTKFHVDLFLLAESVEVTRGGEVIKIIEDSQYILPPM
jgi:aminopeptidase